MAALKWGVDLDLNNNQLQNVKLHQDPTLTVEGTFGYDTTTKRPVYRAAASTKQLVESGAIIDADVGSSAALAYSKLALTGAILNADLAGSIAYSKLSLSNSLVAGDLTADSVTQAKIAKDTARRFKIYNSTGFTFAVDALLHISGYNVANSCLQVELADADNAKPAQLINTASLTNASVGEAVDMQLSAAAKNTASASVGDAVYLDTASGSSAGAWTLTAPTGTNAMVQKVGRVVVVSGSLGQIQFVTKDIEFTKMGSNEIQALAIDNSHIGTSAAIALSKLATDPLARANHTGTQTASTISDFDTQVRTSKVTDLAAPTGSFSMNSQKITNLLDPVGNQDAVTLAWATSYMASGRLWKDPVRAASTASIADLSAMVAYQDGVNLEAGDRFLVWHTAHPSGGTVSTKYCGLYTVGTLTGAGAAAAAASVNISGATASGDVTYTAQAKGTAGNSIRVTHVNPGGANATTTVSVSSLDITVTLKCAGGVVTALGSEVVTAIAASEAATALVVATNPTGAGAGTAAAAGFTSLSGGVNSAKVAPMTRATDADASSEVKAGLSLFVNEGTLYADMEFVLTTNDAITLGTTPLTFAKYSRAEKITASGALTRTNDDIAHNTSGIGAGTYRSVTIDTYGHATAGTNPTTIADYGLTNATQQYNTQITGTGSAATDTITHNLNTRNIWIVARENASPYSFVVTAFDGSGLTGADILNKAKLYSTLTNGATYDVAVFGFPVS